MTRTRTTVRQARERSSESAGTVTAVTVTVTDSRTRPGPCRSAGCLREPETRDREAAQPGGLGGPRAGWKGAVQARASSAESNLKRNLNGSSRPAGPGVALNRTELASSAELY